MIATKFITNYIEEFDEAQVWQVQGYTCIREIAHALENFHWLGKKTIFKTMLEYFRQDWWYFRMKVLGGNHMYLIRTRKLRGVKVFLRQEPFRADLELSRSLGEVR